MNSSTEKLISESTRVLSRRDEVTNSGNGKVTLTAGSIIKATLGNQSVEIELSPQDAQKFHSSPKGTYKAKISFDG